MAVHIVPFAAAHVEAAAELLAVRHRADRARSPELAARWEDGATARPAVQESLTESGSSGVAAMRDGRLIGYLIGALTIPVPGSVLASYVRPRSVAVGYAGHAAEPGGGFDIYREMYAALAPRWLSAGCFSHYIKLPAGDRQAVDAWWSLGFGQESIYGVRDTTEDAPAGAPADTQQDARTPGMRGWKVEVRRAGPDDGAVVLELLGRLERYHADAPVFRPYLAESAAQRLAPHAQHLADPDACSWLAHIDGRPVGVQMYVRPSEDELDVPVRCIHLIEAYTERDVRGGGVGSALLRHAMRWAWEAGYERCMVDWVSPNLSGGRFWLRSGFRPVSTWLVRHVDERIAWATGDQGGTE